MAQRGKNDLGFLFNPESIAVVGASPVPGKLSHIILESLDAAGFRGSVYPVNPKYDSVGGLKCYPSIEAIDGIVDLAVIAVPAEAVPAVIRGAKGRLRGAVVVSGGFGEKDEKGRRLEEELINSAQTAGIRIIGPNCMGIFDAVTGVDTFFIPRDRVKRPKRGTISILSQSGSFALTAIDLLSEEGIGAARVVSYGNRVDVDESDCLEFLAYDDSTHAVALYIESVKDGRRFVEAASLCSSKKPVIAVKVGKSGAGVSAARSHTGALAGRYELYRAAFKKAGIKELLGFEDFMDGCRALGVYRPVQGNRVIIITDGGGVGVNIADACSSLGLHVAPLPEALRDEILKKFPPYFIVGNPLDLTGSVTDEWVATALKRTLGDDGFDAAIVAALWGPPGLTDRLPGLIADCAKLVRKPLIVCSPGGEFSKSKRRLFIEKGLPVFDTPESAARAAAILANNGKKGR